MSAHQSTTTGAGRAHPSTRPPSDEQGFVTVPKGLAKVVVTDTELGDVRGDEGFFHYRQYSAVELAERVGFEQAWHLLERGHLPDDAELAGLHGRGRPPPRHAAGARRPAARHLRDDDRLAPGAAHGAVGVGRRRRPPAALRLRRGREGAAAIAAVAVTPTILAAAHRLHAGLEPVPADPTLRARGRLPAHGDRRAALGA